MRERLQGAPLALLGLATVALLSAGIACSGDEPALAAGAGVEGTGAGTPLPASADPVLRGRWERLFAGFPFDYPNFDPWVDGRDGSAHFVYRSKTGQLRYLLIDGQFAPDGGGTEVTFPQGTKSIGRVVALAGGGSVVFGLENVAGQVSSYLRAPGSTTALPGPLLDPTRGRLPFTFESAELEGDAVFAGVVAKPAGDAGGTPVVAVDRLRSGAFQSLGEFPANDTVSRLRLASREGTLALAVYTGTTTRSVRAYRGGTWHELAGLPPTNGAVGVPSLEIQGSRVFLLEYDESTSTAVVWVHDGSSWTTFARSDRNEGLRSLVLHGGALYALYGDVPNKGIPVTRGIARIDRDLVTKVPFDGQSANGNIDPDSRHDVMSQEECRLVSRGGALFLTYAEGSTATQTLRLYRHVAR